MEIALIGSKLFACANTERMSGVVEIDIVTGNVSTILSLQGSEISNIYVHDGFMYLGGSFDFIINGNNFTNTARYEIDTGNWGYIEPIFGDGTGSPIYDIEIFGSTICYFGNFSFTWDDTEVNNVICGNINGTWVDNLYEGLEYPILQAVYNPTDHNLYVRDSMMNLFYYNGNWNSFAKSNITFLTLWSNPSVKELPIEPSTTYCSSLT